MGLAKYIGAIGRSIMTLGDGLAVTMSYLFRKPMTIQYPDRTAEPVVKMLPERSRGILEVDIEICTGCSMCAKQCPIDCLHILVEKDAETKQRNLVEFAIDAGKCMYCGLCVEACPTSAIRHSHEFEGGMSDVNRLMLHFVDEPRPVAKPPKKGEEVKTKPKGTFVRPMLANALEPAVPRKPRPPKPPAPKPAPKPAAEAKPETKPEPKPEKKTLAETPKAKAAEDSPPSPAKTETPESKPDKPAEAVKADDGKATEDK